MLLPFRACLTPRKLIVTAQIDDPEVIRILCYIFHKCLDLLSFVQFLYPPVSNAARSELLPNHLPG